MNNRIRLTPFTSAEVWQSDLVNNVTAIGLSANSATRYQGGIIDKGLSNFIKITPFTNYGDTARILATTKRGDFHMFKHFESFNMEVYYGIIVSIIVFSVVISAYNNSIKSFFTTLWLYTSVILNGSVNLKNEAIFIMSLYALWLISCTVILAAFSGMLLTLLIKPLPIYWIDSWQDLYEWKHIKIQTMILTDMGFFINKSVNNPVADDFRLRSDVFPFSIVADPLLRAFDLKGMSEGKVAIAFPSCFLHVFKRYLLNLDMIEDIDFHISEFGDPWKPCFIWYNNRKLNRFQQDKLAKV